jgi:hypothetical protein
VLFTDVARGLAQGECYVWADSRIGGEDCGSGTNSRYLIVFTCVIISCIMGVKGLVYGRVW